MGVSEELISAVPSAALPRSIRDVHAVAPAWEVLHA